MPGFARVRIATRRSYRRREVLAFGIQDFRQHRAVSTPGILYSTRQHPIQGFTWSDFSAKPEHDYTYEVFALRRTPSNPPESEKVAVDITTESEHGSTRHVHFNRGAAASQEYTRRFGDNVLKMSVRPRSHGFRVAQRNQSRLLLNAQLVRVGDCVLALMNLQITRC